MREEGKFKKSLLKLTPEEPRKVKLMSSKPIFKRLSTNISHDFVYIDDFNSSNS